MSQKPDNNDELKIVLIGKAGAGKTSIKTSMEKYVEKKLKMNFVDTPGLAQSPDLQEELNKMIYEYIFQNGSGPHVFLYVLQWENDFTSPDKKRIELLREMFGDKLMNYFLLVLTQVEQIPVEEERTIHSFMDEFQFERKTYCGITYKSGNASDLMTPKEQEILMNKITQIVKKNDGRCYTREMFKEVMNDLKNKMPQSESKSNHKALTELAKTQLTMVLGNETLAEAVIAINSWLAKQFAQWFKQ